MIRKAMEKDLPFVYECLCDLEHAALDKEAFACGYRQQLQDASIAMFVQETNGVLQGYCSVRIVYHLHHTANIAIVEELYVCEAWRGKGIGKTLMQHAADHARQGGCIQLELSSNQRRVKAHAFYRKLSMACSHFKFTWNLEEKH